MKHGSPHDACHHPCHPLIVPLRPRLRHGDCESELMFYLAIAALRYNAMVRVFTVDALPVRRSGLCLS